MESRSIPHPFELHVSQALSHANSLFCNVSRSKSHTRALSRSLLSSLSKRGRATSLQTCLMWNAHERRSEKYHQSTMNANEFQNCLQGPRSRHSFRSDMLPCYGGWTSHRE